MSATEITKLCHLKRQKWGAEVSSVQSFTADRHLSERDSDANTESG